MKLLRLITRLNVGGPSRQVQFLHRALRLKGHDAELWHGTLDRGEANDQIDDGCPRTRHLPLLQRPISPLKDLHCLIKLTLHLCQSPVEILHTHTSKAGWVGRSAAWLAKPIRRVRGLPQLRTVHTFHGHTLEGYFSTTLNRCIKSIESFLWRRSDAIVALTPGQRKTISALLQVDDQRCHVIPLGLNLHPFAASPGSKRETQNPTLGWVGRLVNIKNPIGFLRLAAELEKVTGIRPQLLMIGDGPLRPDVEKLGQQLNLDLQLAGWQRDLTPWYPQMDLFVNTSFNEGTPVAALEAMASGTPVLLSNVGGSQEVLPHSPLTRCFDLPFPQWDEVQQVLEGRPRLEPEMRKSIASQFGQERLLEDLNQLYDELLKEKA